MELKNIGIFLLILFLALISLNGLNAEDFSSDNSAFLIDSSESILYDSHLALGSSESILYDSHLALGSSESILDDCELLLDSKTVLEDTSSIDDSSNEDINVKSSSLSSNKTAYNEYIVNEDNFHQYFDLEGNINPDIEEGSTLIFNGQFALKGTVNISKSINIIGNGAYLYNTGFLITASGSSISNLSIVNDGDSYETSNLGAIHVSGASNITIRENNISTFDVNRSYGILFSDSSDNLICDNNIYSNGENLVFSILLFNTNNTDLIRNNIKTMGSNETSLYYGSVSFDEIHTIGEPYKTSALLVYSSFGNHIDNNSINVSSGLLNTLNPYTESLNMAYGLIVSNSSSYNNVSNNRIFVESKDPFLYGIYCYGGTGIYSSADEGGLIFNSFENNSISVCGNYTAFGLVFDSNSFNSSVKGNSFNIKSFNYSYGVVSESSKDIFIFGNDLNLSSANSKAVELYLSTGVGVANNAFYIDTSIMENQPSSSSLIGGNGSSIEHSSQGNSTNYAIYINGGFSNNISGNIISSDNDNLIYSSNHDEDSIYAANTIINLNKSNCTGSSGGNVNNTVGNKKIKTVIFSNSIFKFKTTDKSKLISVTLKDQNKKLLSNKKISFTIGKTVYTAYTDSKGIAKVKINLAAAKTYTCIVKFSGDKTYSASGKTVKIVVKKTTPILTAKSKSFKSSLKTKLYSITLKDNQKKAMRNTKVSLKVNGKTYTAKTNAKGLATFKITKLTKKGSFKATVNYAGSNNYNKVTKTVTIKTI